MANAVPPPTELRDALVIFRAALRQAASLQEVVASTMALDLELTDRYGHLFSLLTYAQSEDEMGSLAALTAELERLTEERESC